MAGSHQNLALGLGYNLSKIVDTGLFGIVFVVLSLLLLQPPLPIEMKTFDQALADVAAVAMPGCLRTSP